MRVSERRLDATLELVDDWRKVTQTLGGERINETVYIANTLLRWGVLDFLLATDKKATWFFGRDNMGLGLEYELYVYNLVPAQNLAFVDFGGKTSETSLYPRSLHLLARQCYVIPFAITDGTESRATVLATAERLRAGLARKNTFFRTLEDRRVALYEGLPAASSLDEAHHRVWQDFLSE